MLIKDVIGQWNMTEDEAIDLARKAIKKFDCDPSLFQFVDDKPSDIMKPFTTGKTVIPHYLITWRHIEQLMSLKEGHYTGDAQQVAWAWAEVDAGTKTLKSVYFDHKSFFVKGKGPPINEPITLSRDKKEIHTVIPLKTRTSADHDKEAQ